MHINVRIHENTHPLQSSPSSSHSSRHSAKLNPYLLSCRQRLLLLHLQDRPVRHSYCCPLLEVERSIAASTAAKTFIIIIFQRFMEQHDSTERKIFQLANLLVSTKLSGPKNECQLVGKYRKARLAICNGNRRKFSRGRPRPLRAPGDGQRMDDTGKGVTTHRQQAQAAAAAACA